MQTKHSRFVSAVSVASAIGLLVLTGPRVATGQDLAAEVDAALKSINQELSGVSDEVGKQVVSVSPDKEIVINAFGKNTRSAPTKALVQGGSCIHDAYQGHYLAKVDCDGPKYRNLPCVKSGTASEAFLALDLGTNGSTSCATVADKMGKLVHLLVAESSP